MTLPPLLQALRADLPGLVLLGFLVGALLLGVELLSRHLRVSREWTRKAVHVGTGLVLLAVPTLLHHLVSVALLAALSMAVLGWAKSSRKLQSVHGVRRHSDGAVLYPVAVMLLYVVSRGQPLRFCVPLLILAVSDAAAALVGQHLGRWRYRVGGCERTLEGSLAFLVTAIAACWAGLLVAGVGAPLERPLLAAGVALVACALEAVSLRGWDNLTVPLGSWLALELALRAQASPASAGASLLCVTLAGLMLTVAILGGGNRARNAGLREAGL